MAKHTQSVLIGSFILLQTQFSLNVVSIQDKITLEIINNHINKFLPSFYCTYLQNWQAVIITNIDKIIHIFHFN